MAPREVSRRELFRRGGQTAAALGGIGLVGAAATTAEPVALAASGDWVEIREGTNMSAALSPDGRHIAIDLCTAIWVLPAEGGTAWRLTDDLQDATQPAWSPDGERIAFQSYRDGNYHLWLIDSDGRGLRQLTTGPFDHREPKFAPDGTRIVFSSDRDGSYGIWLLDLATGAVEQVTRTPEEEGAPIFSPDGTLLAFTVDDEAIDILTLASGERRRAVAAPTGGKIYGPAFGPDGRTPSYLLLRGAEADLMLGDRQLTRDEDVFGFAASWAGTEVVYTADGQIRRSALDGGALDGGAAQQVPFVATVGFAHRHYRRRVRRYIDAADALGPAGLAGSVDLSAPRQVRGIASPVVSPDGTQVAFRAVGALWLGSLSGGRPQRLTADHFFNSDPDFSPDGRRLVYSSDRAGTADLWLRDLTSGAESRLTALPGAQLTPRWSPDGTRIAYVDHNGVVWTVEVATGAVQQVTPTLFLPGRPTWSPDGTVIALAAVKPYSRRFREGTSQILTVDLRTGTLSYAEPMPFRSLSTRGDDGPVWSPDGRNLAFVVESVAWVAPVDPAGRITGPDRQVTREVTDSLAWCGSDALVYLCTGRLRLVRLDGGEPRTIRLELTWRRPAPPSRTIVQAGAVWDGTSAGLRRDVDIVVEDGRIAEVRPHRSTGGDRWLDATSMVVIPGLIDTHNHWHLRGRQWGDRQGRLWLSYGITTTRSPGDPVYQMLETREALESGATTGPRYFATGEAIDGSRIYYNFMRPTLSRAQLDLELTRAIELEYDLIKTYVRLPVELQRAAVQIAHRAGLPLSSHYLYPAANIGMDGMEHTGATNRLGYSHTVSRLGRSYQDAIALFTRSGMSLTPTLFNSAALYADDRSLVDDERTTVLFPPWEYERYVQKANDARLPSAAAMRAMLEANVEMVLRIHREGGLVICGTDAPLDNVAVSLHQNLRAMVAFGFTPHEALLTATRNPARWLGLEGTLGTIAPGALADLSLLAADPLADIRAAASVRMVLLGGTVFTTDELLAPFRPEATPTPTSPTPTAATPATAPALPVNRTLPVMPSARYDREHWWHEPEWAVNVCCGHQGAAHQAHPQQHA